MIYIESYLSREAKKYECSGFHDICDIISNDDLHKILASLHAQLNHWFAKLNGDLRTGYDGDRNKVYSGSYFHAQDSRDLLKAFNTLNYLKSKLHKSPYDFELSNDIYDAAIRSCKLFGVNSGGSTIPKSFEPIEIEYI